MDRVESADIISVAELAQKLFADARSVGIGSSELDEDTGSVFQVMHEAIMHRTDGHGE